MVEIDRAVVSLSEGVHGPRYERTPTEDAHAAVARGALSWIVGLDDGGYEALVKQAFKSKRSLDRLDIKVGYFGDIEVVELHPDDPLEALGNTTPIAAYREDEERPPLIVFRFGLQGDLGSEGWCAVKWEAVFWARRLRCWMPAAEISR